MPEEDKALRPPRDSTILRRKGWWRVAARLALPVVLAKRATRLTVRIVASLYARLGSLKASFKLRTVRLWSNWGIRGEIRPGGIIIEAAARSE